MKKSDRELGMNREITRRDFLNGASVAVGGVGSIGSLGATREHSATAAGGGSHQDVSASGDEYYPPKLTGMRGSHDGSFEVAHEMRDGKSWGEAADSGEHYDLVVVGGGLSGLAAAYYFRKALPDASVLVLDNHDDFGGHARRVEFDVDGRKLVGYGGTQFIDGDYPPAGVSLLEDIGLEAANLPRGSAFGLYRRLGLQSGVFFPREVFGEDRLVVGEPWGSFSRGVRGERGRDRWTEYLSQTPLSEDARRDILTLFVDRTDYLPGLTVEQKIDRLRKMSYQDFILNVVGVSEDVIPYMRQRGDANGAAGIETYSAWGAFRERTFPGLQGLGLPRDQEESAWESNPFNGLHFPDGNAGVARLLVRWLIPSALPGSTMHDSVTTPVRYSQLDLATSPVRIRLNSTVVGVRHAGERRDAPSVTVTYVQDGKALSVAADTCVMACYNAMIPYLCPELPDEQAAALRMAVRKPYCYTQVAIRNWTAFQNLGVQDIHSPGGFCEFIDLDWGVNLGDYRHSASPEEPIMLWLQRAPNRPGLSARDQFRAGREELLATSFETFERNIRDQLGRALGEGGFDPARDIAGITVGRWPHGYAGAANDLYDPDWGYDEAPWVVGRQRFGRIAIANSDAAAISLTQAAFDQAHRAVQELLTDVIRPEFQYPWAERT